MGLTQAKLNLDDDEEVEKQQPAKCNGIGNHSSNNNNSTNNHHHEHENHHHQNGKNPETGRHYRRIYKSRYDSIDSYLSEPGARYNDIELVVDENIYADLLAVAAEDGGKRVDELLGQHVAHLFIRDSLVLFRERVDEALEQRTSSSDMDFFENIQSTNWQTMRFKPPPIEGNENKAIGLCMCYYSINRIIV